MAYTKNQLEAISYEGKNILVSASAGSGKTGVLKERVINKLKNGIDIDKLVVLTFTKAAAEEMKKRIINELENLGLTEQITKVDNAIISTFDAFTLRLVTEYHYLLGLEKNIQINDPVLIKIKKQEMIEKVLREYFIRNETDFSQFFKRYFNKSDNWLNEAVYKVGEAFRKLPNYLEVLAVYEEKYLNIDFLNEKAKMYLDELINELKSKYLEFKDLYMNNINLYESNWQDYLLTIAEITQNLISFADYDSFINKISDIDFPRKPKNKELSVPEIVDHIKSIRKEFNELYIVDFQTLIDNFQTTKASVLVLLEIIEEYLCEFNKIKNAENLYSYEDIMFFAIRLFKEFPDVKTKFKEKTHEILIDEYQDTNDLQDEFISLIANNNVFMVGDVKQSIYRFRDANPKNFMRIYEEYILKDTGKAIFLQENFRTNRFLLDSINDIFTKTMSKALGGVDYKGEQVLKTGYNLDYSLHKLEAFKLKVYNFEEIKSEYPDLSKEEVEAHIFSQTIVERINNKEIIFDLKTQTERELKYEDICILVDRKKEFQTYSKIISKYNIPIDIYDEEPFFSSDEIRFIFQYLLLINCFKHEEYFKKYFKTAFNSVARSFVYQIKDQVISNFFLVEDIDDIQDLNKLLRYDYIKKIHHDINDIITKYWDLPPSLILEKIYDKTHIYRSIASLDNPRQKEEKLDFFLLKVKGFTQFSYQDLIDYLEAIIENDDFDIEYAEKKKQVNAVKLMTIHKSKGLQFPLIYLMGLYKQFKNAENQDLFVFNKAYGILTKSYDEGFFPNYMQKMYFSEIEQENISEKIRLLYVAMTRAINQLSLIIDYDEALQERNNKILSFKHLIYKNININEEMVESFRVIDLDYDEHDLPKTDQDIEIKSFDFEHEPYQRIKYSKSMSKFIDDDVIEFIDAGNEYHHLLVTVDFFDLDNSIEAFPLELKTAVMVLVKTDLFKELKKPQFFKEYEFYQDLGNQIYRGVIDLLIIAEDNVIALDYKLKNIEDEAYYNQLRGYQNFLTTKINKPIEIYLYSLIDRVLKKVEL